MNKWIGFFMFFLFLSIGTTKAQNDSIIQPMSSIQPNYLKAGDSIAIVAPAGILKNKKDWIDAAAKLAESWGLSVKIGTHVFSQNNHFAGTDEERANDFQEALDNPNIKAIWCARGGYGSVRIIDKLNFEKFLNQPKWIIGYSDITTFHNHLNTLGIQSIHGMMGTSMEFENEESKDSLKKALFGEKLMYEFPSSEFNKFGEVEGELVGGNLSILVSMLGSKSQIETDGKILFIEEIGEYKYAIDRMLQSLKRAGYFENLKGLIVGNMSNIKKNTTVWGTSIEQLVLDVISEYNFPVAFGFPAGHEPENESLIMGRKIELEIQSSSSKIRFE